MRALLSTGEVPLDGFLCPGHVSVIIGADAYRPIVDRHRRPCVVAGFEPEQILAGLAALVRLIADGRGAVENVYSGVVGPSGNHVALDLLGPLQRRLAVDGHEHVSLLKGIGKWVLGGDVEHQRRRAAASDRR